MSSALYNEKEVLAKIATGDQQAFDQLYRRYAASMYKALMTYVKNENQADELLQVTFIRFWETRATLPTINNPEGYLFTIAKNTFINWWRKQARERKETLHYFNLLSNSPSEHPDSSAGAECDRIFRTALEQLPRQQRMVYQLVTEDELSYQEVAQRLSISRFTVKKHLELARRTIRKYMADSGYAYMTVTVLLYASLIWPLLHGVTLPR
jgi:RNA polymerase sigma-70 factor (family 1)